MQRPQLEAALRATAQLTGIQEFILVGSQAVHAYTDKPPIEVLISRECDVWAKDRYEKLQVVEDTLGKRSLFAEEKGYYVDPVDPEIVLLAAGWESRLKPMRVGDITAWCLDMIDLVVSKLAAGRLKDYEFINAILRIGLADFDQVVKRIQTFAEPRQQAMLLARLRISSERMP